MHGDSRKASSRYTAVVNSTATVSIVIPSYNYGRFLAEAVESALAQTVPALEVVIADDGSTDDSLAVAERYQRFATVRVLKLPHAGALATFNAGVQATRGAYFVVLSADDRLDPRFIERTLPLLEAHPDAAYVYTAYRMFGARFRVLPARPYDPHLLARRPYIIGTVLMRRAVFDAVGGYSGELDFGYEDWDLFVTLAQREWHGVPLPEVLFQYRQHQATSRNRLPFRLVLRARRQIYERHRSLYRWPLPIFLVSTVLDQQVLRLRALPRAIVRRLLLQRHVPEQPTACLIHDGDVGAARADQLAPALAAIGTVQRVTLSTEAAPWQNLLTRFGRELAGDRTVLVALAAWRRFRAWLRGTRGAIDTRATLYVAIGLDALLAAVIACLIHRAYLIYDPLHSWSRRSQRPLPALWGFLERVALWLTQAVVVQDSSLGAEITTRYALPYLEIQPIGGRAGLRNAGAALNVEIERARFEQLCKDLLARA
jgi:GT2 family glycosyltransferase